MGVGGEEERGGMKASVEAERGTKASVEAERGGMKACVEAERKGRRQVWKQRGEG